MLSTSTRCMLARWLKAALSSSGNGGASCFGAAALHSRLTDTALALSLCQEFAGWRCQVVQRSSTPSGTVRCSMFYSVLNV